MFSGCLEQSGCKVLAHTYPRAHTHDSWRCGPLFHELDEAHASCCRGAFCGSICVKVGLLKAFQFLWSLYARLRLMIL